MKRIAVFTCFNFQNYGTALQALSLYKFLAKKNDVYLVSYFNTKKINLLSYRSKQWIKYLISPVFNLRNFFLSGNFIKGLKISRCYKNIKIYSCNSRKKILAIEDFDLLITGSDQIWNPYYLDEFYLLGFSKNKNKISYSSSIGVQSLPDEKKDIYRKYLSQFSNISVREKSAEYILKHLLNRDDICTVLDPVYLFDKNEWKEFYERRISKKMKNKVNGSNYIFCYFIGDRFEYKDYVDIISKKYGLQAIYIPSSENKNIVLNGKCIRSAGLEDFLFYIANAQLVVTDSFHATSFSLIFEKQFIEFLRFDRADAESQNSRIFDLLEKYELSNRVFEGNEIPVEEIDYSIVSNKIKKDIDFSFQYLNSACGKEF